MLHNPRLAPLSYCNALSTISIFFSFSLTWHDTGPLPRPPCLLRLHPHPRRPLHPYLSGRPTRWRLPHIYFKSNCMLFFLNRSHSSLLRSPTFILYRNRTRWKMPPLRKHLMYGLHRRFKLWQQERNDLDTVSYTGLNSFDPQT